MPEAGFDQNLHNTEQLDPSLTWRSGRRRPTGLAGSELRAGGHLLPFP